MKNLRKLLCDFTGLMRLCGVAVGCKWLLMAIIKAKEILQRGDLQPADQKMGLGPFKIRFKRGGPCFWIMGQGAVSGIREMYVRDCYLRGGKLTIEDGDTVLDLGANMGNFTNLALAHGPNVRVIAVEPNSELNAVFMQSVSLNEGFQDRVTLIRAFVGGMTEKQREMMQYASSRDALRIDTKELVAMAKSASINFLKCDIEGAEFELFNKQNILLERTLKIAMEIHSFAGDVRSMLGLLQRSGFTITSTCWDKNGSCTVLAKR